jgi:hypothetical protein
MGTIVMVFSISIQASYSIEDQSIYFRGVARPSVVPLPGEAVSPAGTQDLRDQIKPPRMAPSKE